MGGGYRWEIEHLLGDDLEWQDRFDSVSDDLRSALQRPATDGDGTDFALALALGRLSYARRFLVEARDHLEDAVVRAPDQASAARALRFAASIAFAEMKGEAAFALLQASSARASMAGDTRRAPSRWPLQPPSAGVARACFRTRSLTSNSSL